MYRTPPEPARPCHVHPTSEALTQCTLCRVAVCATCTRYVGFRVACGRCQDRVVARSRRLASATGGVVLVLCSLFGAAALAVVTWSAPPDDPAAYEIPRFEELYPGLGRRFTVCMVPRSASR
jgi:hypothetical protein